MRPSVRVIINEVRQRLQQIYGPRLRQVILYGSQARGEAVEGSDIDLLIVLDDFADAEAELERMAPVGAELSLNHDALICFSVVRAADYRERRTPLLENIRREGVPV